MRKQNGSIILRSGKWYVSYWEQRNISGTVERKRLAHLLGAKTTRSKYPPQDIEDACKQHMATVNANTQAVKPEHVLTIVDFVDSVYMPWVRSNKRAATINGYEKIWKAHLKDHFASLLLRDYQPSIATAFLTRLAEEGMGVNAVSHVGPSCRESSSTLQLSGTSTRIRFSWLSCWLSRRHQRRPHITRCWRWQAPSRCCGIILRPVP